MKSRWIPAIAGLSFLLQAYGQTPAIQDNSFLIEEAYNQEPGVVHNASTFSRMWNSKDWIYTFTQEWPGRKNPRHQFSYSLIGMHAGGFPGSGSGVGDVALHYRYQVAGDGESRVAFAPRASLMLPSGDPSQGRGYGGVGFQTNLPVSVVLHRRVISHSNVGSTFVRTTAGYSAGQGLIFVAHPRFNVLVEAVDSRFQSGAGWSRTMFISPGVRWAHNFKSGLQIVPGVAVPVGAGPSAGEKGLFLYLSFEHPIKLIRFSRYRGANP